MNSTYQISYYGLLAERRGLAVETINHPGNTPAEIYQAIDVQYLLGMQSTDLRVAVNDEFVAWDHPLKNNDQIAFLPPMSGG
jgi:sulfur-carrier protein